MGGSSSRNENDYFRSGSILEQQEEGKYVFMSLATVRWICRSERFYLRLSTI